MSKQRKATKYLIIHCSATRAKANIGAKEIDVWHRRDNGWRKIGYHFVTRRNGVLETGRGMNEVGAHAVGPTPEGEVESKNWWNENSIGFCWVGGLNDDTFAAEDNRTPEQVAQQIATIKFLKGMYPDIKILGHRDIPGVNKACPCFDVAAFLKEHGL